MEHQNHTKPSSYALLYVAVILAAITLCSYSGKYQRFTKVNMLSGLSYNSALCVLQDTDNFLWVGTRDGLNKYNSLDNVIYKHRVGDSTSLSHSHVNVLYQTQKGTLWVGTVDGLNKYDATSDAFKQYQVSDLPDGITNGYVKCMVEDSKGALWIGTSYGLNKYNASNNTFEHVFLSQPPSYDNNVIALFNDDKDRLWVGTRGGIYIRNNHTFEKLDLSAFGYPYELFEIRDIKQRNDDRYVIATEQHGLLSFYYSAQGVQSFKALHTGNSSIVSNSIRKLYVDRESLWLATLEGVSILDESDVLDNIVYSEDNPSGISNSSIHDITKDHMGGIWLATYTGGLNYYNAQNNLFTGISRLGEYGSIKSAPITGFIEDDKDGLWISTGSGGLMHWDMKNDLFENFTSRSIPALSNDNIKTMSADKEGNLWIGTYNGLNHFDVKQKSITHFFSKGENTNSLNNNQVHAVCVDHNGKVWIGTNGGNFQVYDPQNGRFTDVSEVGNIVNAIYEDSKGRIWVSERFGLKCLDASTRELIDINTLTDAVGDELEYINWISEDMSGRILIGTMGAGLVIFDEDKLIWFNTSDGLIDNAVNAVLQDEGGNYWISTNNGISHLKVKDGDFSDIEFINYTENNGLQGKQFEKGSAIKLAGGDMVFGGVNGINVFTPEEVKEKVYFPSVVLSDFNVNTELGNESERYLPNKSTFVSLQDIELPYEQRNFSLSFAGINFVSPHQTYYRYKIGESQKDWINLGHQRNLNFTLLPVGKHEVKIQASTKEGVWGTAYKSLFITILPPWWQTWWAYLFYFLIVVGALFLLLYYYQRWVDLKNSLAMEHFTREKEQELHESKLRFFTDVSHELRTPLTLILAPLESIMSNKALDKTLSRQLLLIHKNGNRMMRLINQVLDLRRLEAGHVRLKAAEGDFVIFLREISLLFKEVAVSQKIEFNFSTDFSSYLLWYDRDKMESVLFNLLSNAFKHSHSGGRVTMHLGVAPIVNEKGHCHREFIQIAISNEGKGIPQAELPHIFERFYSKTSKNNPIGAGVGLDLCRRMVKLHHGDINVRSTEETSDRPGLTSFMVQLPTGKQHLTEDEIITDFKNSETVSLYTHELQLRERDVVDEAMPPIELPEEDTIAKATLLVVEDNGEVRRFISDLLKEQYIVKEAENGRVGLEMAIELLPDLIISDVMMPEMDGIELCKTIKTDLRTSHIPVVLLTARTTFSYQMEGLEVGADDYVNKPFSAEFLQLRIRNLIQQRKVLSNYYSKNSFIQADNVALTSMDERLMKKAIDYILDNIEDSSISVERLSTEVGLSRVHFYRKIKAITNQTAVDFIRSVRLKKAASLLQQNKLSIKEIQHMVGFDNANYFRKCFKEQFDMTPSEYAMKFKDL